MSLVAGGYKSDQFLYGFLVVRIGVLLATQDPEYVDGVRPSQRACAVFLEAGL